jgi:transposase
VVIGIDCHKVTLAVCAVDALGAEVSTAAFRNTASGHEELLAWVRALGGPSRIGIEGAGFYGYALARFLSGAGEVVVEVPARLTERERGRLRRPGKSDPGDALAIARVAAREEHLPPAGRDDAAHELRQLLEYREQLVKERTRVANRLHADLATRFPGYQEAVKNLVSRRWLRAAEAIVKADTSVDGALSSRRLGKLLSLGEEVSEVSRLIADRVARRGTGLSGISGRSDVSHAPQRTLRARPAACWPPARRPDVREDLGRAIGWTAA